MKSKFLSAHTRYVKRKKIYSFISVEINVALLVFNVIMAYVDFRLSWIVNILWLSVCLLYSLALFNKDLQLYHLKLGVRGILHICDEADKYLVKILNNLKNE